MLDLRSGVLVRSLEWTAPGGKRIALRSRRVVSLANKHLFAIEVALTPLNFSGTITLTSFIDGAVKNQEAGDDPRVGSAVSGPALHTLSNEQDASFSALVQRTHNSGFMLVSAIDTHGRGMSMPTHGRKASASARPLCARLWKASPCA